MPGPPTINWYRADLRSALPGGLSRPADHLYQSLLFFFTPPPLSPRFHSTIHQVQGSVCRSACRTDGSHSGEKSATLTAAVFIDAIGTQTWSTRGHVCLVVTPVHVLLCPIVSDGGWEFDHVFCAFFVKTLSPSTNKLSLHKQQSLFSALCSSSCPFLK